MKSYILFLIFMFFMLSLSSFSQWTYCPGSVNMTGLGLSPVISNSDQNTAWVAGGTASAPKVYRTTNGGMNFLNATGTLTGPEFYSVWAINVFTCLVGDGGAVGGTGGNAKIWRTSDGGITWNVVLTTGGTAGFFNGISGLNSNRNFVYTQSNAPTGTNQLTAVSTNGGLNWVTGSTAIGGTTGSPGTVWCSGTQLFGHGISGQPRVVFTSNGGATFTPGNISVTGNVVSGFTMNDNGQIMLAATTTSLPNISRSSDFGATWSNINAASGFSGRCVLKWVQGTPAAFMFGTAASNPIKKSVNNGLNWSAMTTSSITNLTDMSFNYFGIVIYGYAISGDGYVIKLADTGPDGINLLNSTIPDNYSLEQNYPNPFNPVTNIRFSIPVNEFVTLFIIDATGKIADEPVKRELAPGNYTVDFDASNLASGIYFYRITAGTFVHTMKMVIVK